MNNGFYKNRRFKSFLFLAVCFLISTIPHLFNFQNFYYFTFAISFLIACYGINIISKNLIRRVSPTKYEIAISDDKLPVLDILVAARDEENVIERLVERLFNLDYPTNKLNIYIIDDGSVDKTPLILERLSREFEKLKIINRSANAGGGKSGALNYALKFTHGEWTVSYTHLRAHET